MIHLILKRLLWMMPTLLAISFISFALIQLPPGDYLTSYITALEETGESVAEEQVEALRQRYNLDEPFFIQYGKWLNNLLPFGFTRQDSGSYLWVYGEEGVRSFNWPGFKWPDFGMSFEWNRQVMELIGERIFLTVVISIVTLLFTWALAIPIGIYAALKPYTKLDYVINLLCFAGISIPSFWLALLVIILFAVTLAWFPAGGMETIGHGGFWDRAWYMVLPVLVLTLHSAGGFTRYMRASMLQILTAHSLQCVSRSKRESQLGE